MRTELKPVATGLSGAEVLDALHRGHMVRRACWQRNFLIRICNEQGYDERGYAILGRRSSAVYTHATSGSLMHIGYSPQPFKDVRVWKPSGQSRYEVASCDGEGIAMLFAMDWEDYGFASAEAFDKLTEELRDGIREDHKQIIERAIKGAKSRESVT